MTDQRLLRGARSRLAIVRHAVDVASLEGLGGLSIGRLATDLGISKSGVQTLFGSKENLQVAAAEYARGTFVATVVRPAEGAPAGVARLRALFEHWLDYAREPLFPGGCFWGATLAEFDSRPGPVHDVLFGHQRVWRALLAAQLRAAMDAGELAETGAEVTAFQIDAVLTVTNIALRAGDDTAEQTARQAIETILTKPLH